MRDHGDVSEDRTAIVLNNGPIGNTAPGLNVCLVETCRKYTGWLALAYVIDHFLEVEHVVVLDHGNG